MTMTANVTAMHGTGRGGNGVARLVRRLERERRRWTRPTTDGVGVATEAAWRAGVAEGLRLAQTAIRKGV